MQFKTQLTILTILLTYLAVFDGVTSIVAVVAEAKFKEVLLSYEAIKEERKEK